MFERIKRRWREARGEGTPPQASSADRGDDAATAASNVALLEAQELVNKYGAVLEHRKTITSSETILPAPKQRIEDALVTVARHAKTSGATPETLESLRVGYASLADFVSESDAKAVIILDDIARNGAQDLDDAELNELARKAAASGASALDVNRRTTEEFARLTAEFDARVRE